MKWYCDGSGWNGKRSGYAVIGKGIYIQNFDVEKTNNEMEYEAVLYALRNCNPGDQIVTDSQLVVNQVLGKWRIKEDRLKPLCAECQRLMDDKSVDGKNCVLGWIPREENKAGKYF
jgi:ribonuclease HI